MVIQDGKEPDDHTGDGTRMEEHVGELYVDGAHASAQAVHQDGWTWKEGGRIDWLINYLIYDLYQVILQKPEKVMKPATMSTGCKLNCSLGLSLQANPPR